MAEDTQVQEGLRPDQLFMIGVAVIGVYAIWRLRRTRSTSPQTTEGTQPATDAPVVTDTPFTQDIVHRNIALNPGRRYSARLDLAARPNPISTDGLDRRIGASSSAQEVRVALEALGFANVQVFMNPTEAANRFLPAINSPAPTSVTRWFIADWRGQQQPGAGAGPRPKTLSQRFTYVYPTTGGAALTPAPLAPDAAIWRYGAQVIARPPENTSDFNALLSNAVVFQGGELVKRTGETAQRGGWIRILFQTTDGRVLDGWVGPSTLIPLPAVSSAIAGYPYAWMR